MLNQRTPRLHMRCPFGAEQVWEWFRELCLGRVGSEPLPYSEIAAWAELTGAQPNPEDIAVLKELDVLFVTAVRANKNG